MGPSVSPSVPIEPLKDMAHNMKAVEFFGSQDVRVVDHPRPMVTHPKDAIVRITTTTVCGSDLHMYLNLVPEMHKGDILGHEFMGIVEAVGNEVSGVKPGDRVVVSAVISDGTCWYCRNGQFSLCDSTNDSKTMENMYGDKISGIFGYSHLTGGYPGGQAEYARVPYADVNLLHVPEHLSDEQVLFLSDICCTGYHATELAEVQPGQTVAVWGCGPVGLMAQKWAKFKGASKVIAIDKNEFRLSLAKNAIGSEPINFEKEDVVKRLKEICPGGPDVGIEAAGFRFPKTTAQSVQMGLKLETDSTDILDEIVRSVRKGGSIGIVGDYFGYGNHFPIGPFMEKGQTMRGSQVFVQKYWKTLLDIISRGEFDPTFVITHRMRLEDSAKAYKMFSGQEDNSLKIILNPHQ
jgi:threonine dehydrogenase-like Zn-dependent dehydrogenase